MGTQESSRGINIHLQDPSRDLSSNPKKRKASQSIGSLSSLEVNAARVRRVSHPTGAGPSSQPDPEPQQSGKGGSEPSTPLKIPRKYLLLGRCLAKASQGAKWREIQSELGLDTREKYEQVVQRFHCHAHVASKRECAKEPGQSNHELIGIGKKLTAVMQPSRGDALQKSVYYFQVLILFSYCEFLRVRDVSDANFDQLLKTILPRERDRNALQRSILRIHKLIVELVRKGWTVERATELIFINAIPPSVLIRYGSDENFDALLGTLSTDTFVNGNFDDCLTPRFTIPGIIASHFEFADRTDQNWLVEIYYSLGYDLPNLPSSVKGIYKVQPAKSAPICPRVPEYKNLTINSFNPASNNIYGVNGHTMTSAQDPHRSHNLQRENLSREEILKRSQLRQIYQQSEELARIFPGHAIVDEEALKASHCRAPAGCPGPQFQLSLEMPVPDTAQSINLAIKGDIDGLKNLFSRGLASPRDVSYPRRFSLTRWALYGGMDNYKTVQFLLSQGAFVDEESYQHVWDYAYRQRCNVAELEELRCIMMHPPSEYMHKDWVEEQRFPHIHNLVFGRFDKSSGSLRAELDENPNAVRLTDAMGRTALDWAAALGQLDNMKLLIKKGSPLDTMDVSGRTTVLHAVDSHNPNALFLILDAGADPNPEVPPGKFRSSPLTAASFGGLLSMVKLLIEFGAKFDARNPEGRTPLQTAIIYNNHAVLRLILNYCDISHFKGLLPIIAKSADAETMLILTSSNLLKQTLINLDSFTAYYKIILSRKDYNEELHNAFHILFPVASVP